MAGLALLVVAVTGVTRAISEVGGFGAWRRLVDTSFGVTLLVKIGLFAGLVALGARNRYVNVPRVRRGGGVSSLRHTLGAEVVLAAGILGVTAVLTGLPPASSVAATAAPVAIRGVVATGTDFGTTVRVRLSVTPGTAGPNAFRATVTDYDTGRPVPATALSLAFTLPGHPELGTPTLALRPDGTGTWAAQGTDLSLDGRWSVSVLVQQPTGAVTVPLNVQTRLPPEQISVIPGGPGQPTLYTITLTSGRSLQTYIDPGTPGPDTVHFTFFQASGTEQVIASATASAVGPDGTTRDLSLIRFDPGHFGANVTLTTGSWRFQIQATAPTGEVYSGYFTQSIGR
jgi:nitrogen fixation protein FixH